jgi:hypothetical protein
MMKDRKKPGKVAGNSLLIVIGIVLLPIIIIVSWLQALISCLLIWTMPLWENVMVRFAHRCLKSNELFQQAVGASVLLESGNRQEKQMASVEFENFAKGQNWGEFSPEEYVARFSHGIMCWGFDEYDYPDRDFDRWIKRVSEILPDFELKEHYRRTLLTPEEYQKVLREIEEGTD